MAVSAFLRLLTSVGIIERTNPSAQQNAPTHQERQGVAAFAVPQKCDR